MKVEFDYNKRNYSCAIASDNSIQELRIRNTEGQVLAVQQGQRIGLLGRNRQEARKIDVSKPYFYNLIKTAIRALEAAERKELLQEKDQVIQEKDQIINAKDVQINILNQQLELLNAKLSQLSTEQQQQIQELQLQLQDTDLRIKEREEFISQLQFQINQLEPISDAELEIKIREKLGDAIWQRLHQSSQKDLCNAWGNYKRIKAKGLLNDYTEAGVRLGFTIEREVVTPFFQDFHTFLMRQRDSCPVNNTYNNTYSNTYNNTYNNTYEIGGVTLGNSQSYTLGKLPHFLTPRWLTFNKEALELETISAETTLYRSYVSDRLNLEERDRVQAFLNQWQHPACRWLRQAEKAASSIDQITKLRNRASHPVPLYLWQFRTLWGLIMGLREQRGILQEIYG